ncbi:MAG: hypothetical protein K2X38_03295 [Gemmataceae bacterium]|nr:hypothetical protein [Gemmataceae bacterium]
MSNVSDIQALPAQRSWTARYYLLFAALTARGRRQGRVARLHSPSGHQRGEECNL